MKWLTALAGVSGIHLAAPAQALAQAVTSTAGSGSSPTGDPLNALWSLLGSGTVATVLYLWLRSERADRVAATTSRDQLVTKLVALIEADADNKAQIRERLRGQDEVLTRLLDQQRNLERAISERNARPPTRGGG